MVLLFCNWPYETLRPVLFCFALTTFIILLCFLFNATFLSHSAWNIVDESGFRFGKGGCEMKRENDFLVQRANSVSNFTFAFSGLVMFACAYKDYKNGKSKLGASVLSQTSNLATFPNYIVAFPELSVKLGCACLLMAATSFIWHASMSTVGADLDFGSMYVLIVYILTLVGPMRLLSMCKLRTLNQSRALVNLVSFAGGICGINLFVNKNNIENQTIVVLGLIIAVGLSFPICSIIDLWKKRRDGGLNQFGSRRNLFWAIAALFLILAGFAFRLNDDPGKFFCELWGPAHIMQAHALWHSCCALSVLCCYLFLRSEAFYGGGLGEEILLWSIRTTAVAKELEGMDIL